ncbi:MAG: deoxyribonuclease IV [Chloroflexi bacterium]|nr:MAG: deoxyribonuclease IV [Chloroflexota bacterium]
MRIGRHMPTNSKPVKAAEMAHQIGCDAMQIFASNPTGWRPPLAGSKQYAAFAQAIQTYDLDPVVLHAPYLINLGTLDETIWEKSIALLTWTMQRAALLGARYVVCHTGSHRGAGVEAGIARVAQGVARVLQEAPTSVMLLLENDVGAGHSLGYSFAHLAAILNQVPQYQQSSLGICLDTAHLWGAGHDISTAASARQVLDDVQASIGLAHLQVLHLNETEKALGSHRDVHARLGEGVIGDDGLRAILTDPRLAHVTVLMETPIKRDAQEKEDWLHDATQIAKARQLAETSIPAPPGHP